MAIFDSAKARLAELLKQIETGKLQLLDFQRGWVWNDENIRSLLATIASEFPLGAVMLGLIETATGKPLVMTQEAVPDDEDDEVGDGEEAE